MPVNKRRSEEEDIVDLNEFKKWIYYNSSSGDGSSGSGSGSGGGSNSSSSSSSKMPAPITRDIPVQILEKSRKIKYTTGRCVCL